MSISQSTNVWSTKKVENLLREFNRTGVLPMHNPFFMRKTDKRKADLVWNYEQSELVDMAICKKFILKYAEKCKVMTKNGLAFIKLRPYQVVLLKKMTLENFFIYLASRQIGKSIIIGIFISWIVTFFSDKACLLGSENLGKAKDLKAKIDVIVHNLPLYMQNGVVYFSTQRTIWDNGSRIQSEPTTKNFGVSGSYNVVYIDEFALLEDQLQDEIIKHVVPTLDSFGDEARLIISTTPRGKNNKFFYLWNDSLQGKNKFGNFTTKWYEIEDRDEEWRQNQIAIIGIEGFNQEYDLSFQADSTLLFGSDDQKKLDKSHIKYVYYPDESKDIIENYIIPDRHNNSYSNTKISEYELPEGLESYSLSNIFSSSNDKKIHDEIFCLREDLNIDDLLDDNRQFVLSIDLAGGGGNDYSVGNIFEIVPMTFGEIQREMTAIDETSFFKLEQAGMIRTNLLEVEDFAKFIYYFLVHLCNHQNFRMVLEINYEGGLFTKTLFEVNGSNNLLEQSEIMVEFPVSMDYTKEDAVYKMGIKQNDNTKTIGVKESKRLHAKGKLIISESNTIYEAQGFGKNKKGKYEGTTKNDDCFVSVVNLSHYPKTNYFMDQIEDLFAHLDVKIIQEIAKKIGESMADNDDDYSDYDAFD